MVEPTDLGPEVSRADGPFLVAAAGHRLEVEGLLHRSDQIFLPLRQDVLSGRQEADGSEVIDAVVSNHRGFVADGHVAVVDGAAVRVQAKKILERKIKQIRPCDKSKSL